MTKDTSEEKLRRKPSRIVVGRPINGTTTTTFPTMLLPQAHTGSGLSLASPLVIKQSLPAGSIILWTIMLEPPLKTIISPAFSSPGEAGIETTTSPTLIEGVMLPLLTASTLTPRKKEPDSRIDKMINMIERVFEEDFRA
jgi:hypothetical protein